MYILQEIVYHFVFKFLLFSAVFQCLVFFIEYNFFNFRLKIILNCVFLFIVFKSENDFLPKWPIQLYCINSGIYAFQIKANFRDLQMFHSFGPRYLQRDLPCLLKMALILAPETYLHHCNSLCLCSFYEKD